MKHVGFTLILVLWFVSGTMAADYTIIWGFDDQANVTQDTTELTEPGTLVDAQWTPDGKHG